MIGEIKRMQEDLGRNLRKPIEKRRWVMVVDNRKCIGCNACTVACIAENNLPPGVTYRTVMEVETGEYPEVTRIFMPTNCQQCEDPPCQKAAPSGAITKRKDGIVEFDYTKLRGKETYEKVKEACPYTAVYYDDGRFYTEGTPKIQGYEKRAATEYGKKWPREKGAPPISSARKCHFCIQRLDSGMLPACVSACIGRAMYFGDLNDGESLVSELLLKNVSVQINQDYKTGPKVYYLAESLEAGAKACLACHS